MSTRQLHCDPDRGLAGRTDPISCEQATGCIRLGPGLRLNEAGQIEQVPKAWGIAVLRAEVKATGAWAALPMDHIAGVDTSGDQDGILIGRDGWYEVNAVYRTWSSDAGTGAQVTMAARCYVTPTLRSLDGQYDMVYGSYHHCTRYGVTAAYPKGTLVRAWCSADIGNDPVPFRSGQLVVRWIGEASAAQMARYTDRYAANLPVLTGPLPLDPPYVPPTDATGEDAARG